MDGLMEFLAMNSDLLIIFGVVAAVVFFGVYVAPTLKKKGIVKESDLELTEDLLQLVQLVLSEVRLKNDSAKEKAAIVIKIAESAVSHVRIQMDENMSVEDKRSMAVVVAINTLKEMKIEVDEGRLKLINVVINNAFR